MEGTPFGRYRLISLLGRGGMGEVWRAFDTVTNREVAVKVLPAHLADDPQFEKRFRQEAFAAAGLADPHVVPIHDFGEIDGRLYVDMRLIAGRDLQTLLSEGPLDPVRAVGIIDQVGSALDAAHQIGLVHRDVKPSNILVAARDFAYLIDFGIARAAGATKLTGTGNVIGTWAYLAPERVTTGQTDARADVYSLACVLHECLTGQQPFPGDSIEQQIGGHLGLPPPRPTQLRGDLPAELDTVIATGMSKNPDERYPSVTALTDAAQAAITRPSPQPATVVPPTQPAAAATQPAHLPGSIHSSPTQRRTPTDPGPEASPPDNFVKRHRTHIVLALAVLAILAIVTTIAVSSLGDTAPSANINAGPLSGTFTAAFEPETVITGEPASDAPPGEREIWGFESTCGSQGCIATASMIDGPEVFVVPDNTVKMARALVLDDVGGRWVAVTKVSGTCGDAPTDYWEILSLLPRPDGNLTGERSYASTTTGCQGLQQVTFTRTGDKQPDVSIADPAVQPRRESSPAQALHGRYHDTRIYQTGPVELDLVVETHCLRTATQCLSLFREGKNNLSKFEYANGRWVEASAPYRGTCPNTGSPSSIDYTLEYPLPQPPQDPIALLTGRGHYNRTGDCAYDGDFESRLVRTGD